MKKNILLVAFIVTALMFGCTGGSSNNDPQPNNTNNPNNPSVPAFCRPTQIRLVSGTATVNYNTSKQITTIDMPNNRVITFTYTNNRITRFTEAPITGATTANTSTFDFTYDAQNQITKCDLSINGGTAIENNITYTPVLNSTDTNVNIAYRDGTALAGNGSYNFVITIAPTTKAVNAYSMSYTQNTTCPPNSVPVTASYNYNSTISGYTTTSAKTIWAEMNIPLPIRFFLNRYFISTTVNDLSTNPIVIAYLSDVAPSSISNSTSGGGCFGVSGTTAHSYTHTTNNRNVVTATTVTQQTQIGNPPTTTYNYTHNCD